MLAAVIALIGVAQVMAAEKAATPANGSTAAAPTKESAAPKPAPAATGVFAVVNKLGLSMEQSAKIKAIEEATKEQRKKLTDSRLAASNKLTDLAASGASDADIRAAAIELGKIAGDRAIMDASTWKEIKAVLTAEQQTKLQELLKAKNAPKAKAAPTTKTAPQATPEKDEAN